MRLGKCSSSLPIAYGASQSIASMEIVVPDSQHELTSCNGHTTFERLRTRPPRSGVSRGGNCVDVFSN
jgi:hypothetical protein